MEKNEEIYHKIDQTSEIFGLKDEEKTIFEIIENSDTNEKKLTLKSGSWNSKEPWFGIDKNGELHTMISIKSLSSLIGACKSAMKENFDLKLEKSILKKAPIDFGDVWVVCMDEIKELAKENENINHLNIDLDNIVDRAKKKHPNLFVNIDELIRNREDL